jgi:hypothetical protein
MTRWNNQETANVTFVLAPLITIRKEPPVGLKKLIKNRNKSFERILPFVTGGAVPLLKLWWLVR